jgi:polar amino acid transport system substrate-binding protein
MSMREFDSGIGRRTFIKKGIGSAFGLGLGAVSVPAFLAACGSSPTAGGSNDLLSQIIAKGSIKSGVWIDPPYEITDPNNQNQVISLIPDMLALMAKDLGVKLDQVLVSPTVMVAGLQTAKYDMIGASMSATPERAKAVSFTYPYSQDGQIWFVSKSNPKHLTTPAQLNSPNITIAVSAGSAGQTITMSEFPKATIRALTVTNAAIFAELQSGRADAVCEASLWRAAVEAKFPDVLSIPDNDAGLDPEAQVWGVRMGQENESLRDYLSGFIWKVTSNGTYQSLRDKWFTAANTIPGL